MKKLEVLQEKFQNGDITITIYSSILSINTMPKPK